MGWPPPDRQELDQGFACLPKSVSSEVVLVNMHNMAATLGQLREELQLHSIRVRGTSGS